MTSIEKVLYRSDIIYLNKPEYNTNLKKWGNTLCTEKEASEIQSENVIFNVKMWVEE